MITDHLEIADRFCKYFINIGPALASKIPQINSSFCTYLTSNENSAIFISPTNADELDEICRSFQSSKALGFDDIPIHLIKNSFDLIAEPLTQIINLLLSTAVFPDKLKIAKIIPIHKSEDHDNFTNYRSIFLLTNLSKIFEKVMHKRLISFTRQYKILYCYQFNFGKKYSTSMALIHLVNKLTTAIDCKEITAGIFLDLSKAFDTIDHDSLFAKFEHYDICGLALK